MKRKEGEARGAEGIEMRRGDLLSLEGGIKETPSLLNSAFRKKQETFLQGHRPVSAGKRGLPTRMES